MSQNSYLAALVRSCGDPADSLFRPKRLLPANAVKSGIVAAGKQAANAARDMAAQAGGGDDNDEEGNGNPFEERDDSNPVSGNNTSSANPSMPAVFAAKYRFKNELVAAAQVQNDVEVLSEFFYEYHGLIGRYGVEDELQPMGNVAGIIELLISGLPNRRSKSLVSKYGYTGVRVVRSVIHANPSLSKPEKVDFIKQLQKLADIKLGSEGASAEGLDGLNSAFDVEEDSEEANSKRARGLGFEEEEIEVRETQRT